MTYEPVKSHTQSLSRQQLHLFDPPRPLLQRLGEAFFRAAPRAPGVYIMTGPDERVLYIGQSANLRARLASYKNARPDRAPRKVIRLVRSIASITWEKCADARAARLQENELLRRHRPKFNKVNTYPQAYTFIAMRCDRRELELCRTNQPAESWRPFPPPPPSHSPLETPLADAAPLPVPPPAFFVYGAFKTRTVAAFGALLRLLWAAVHQPSSPHDFPSPLLHAKPPRRFRLSLPDPTSCDAPIFTQLPLFLKGADNSFLEVLSTSLPPESSLCPFHRALQRADLETLNEFYRCGPRRNYQLRAQGQTPCSLIPQEQLDDLLALASPSVLELRRKNYGDA